MSNPYSYTCDECGGTFTAEWSQEEALAEFRQTFGREKTEDDAEVCDDCYKAAMKAREGEVRSMLEKAMAQGFQRFMMNDPKFQAELRKLAEEDATPPDGSPGTG